MIVLRPILASLTLAAPALAQPANVVLSWEFSTNAGATWTPDALVINSTAPTSVRVRGRMSWDNTDRPHYFASLFVDAFVGRGAGSGFGDFLRDPTFLRQGSLYADPFAVVQELGSILKIDRADDLELPGLGARWISANQTPQLLEVDDHNPVTVFQYDYLIDGTPGVRTTSAVLRTGETGSTWFFYNVSPALAPAFATIRDGTITVVPAPAATLALVPLTAGLTTTRRRRR